MSLAPQVGQARHLAGFSSAGGLSFGAAALASGTVVERSPAAFALAGATFFPLQGAFAAGALARLCAAVLGWVLLGRGATPPRVDRHGHP